MKVHIALIVLPCIAAAQGVLSNQTGRFVFGQVSEYANSRYMLDTHTGRLWQFGLSEDDSTAILYEVMYSNADGSKRKPCPFDTATEKKLAERYDIDRKRLAAERSADEIKLARIEMIAEIRTKQLKDSIELAKRIRPGPSLSDEDVKEIKENAANRVRPQEKDHP